MFFAIITTLFHCSVHQLSRPPSLSCVFTNLVSVAGWLHVPAMLKTCQLFLLSCINSFCQCMAINVVSVNQFCFNYLVMFETGWTETRRLTTKAAGLRKDCFLTGRNLGQDQARGWGGGGDDPSAEDDGRGEGEIEKDNTSITNSGGHQWSWRAACLEMRWVETYINNVPQSFTS